MSVLDGLLARPPPWPIWIGTYLIPYIIAYLVWLPDTVSLRKGLWPVGVLCMSWVIISGQIGDEPLMMLPFSLVAMDFNLSGGLRSAFFQPEPPTIPPLPTKPFFHSLRQTTAFKAFDLWFDCNRRTYLEAKGPHTPYLRAVTRRSIAVISHGMLKDIIGFPGMYLYPADHASFGFQTFLGSILRTASIGLSMYQGTAGVWEAMALVAIASGLYTNEEWPKAFHQPLLADSMVEFWGKRYHKFIRTFCMGFARPFRYISRSAELLAAFVGSAVYHVILYYPFNHRIAWPHFTFWAGLGLGCILERAFYKTTGRPVRGWPGRIWAWSWMLLWGQSLARYEREVGWESRVMEMNLQSRGEESPLCWILYGLGVPGPLDWKKQA